MTCSDAEDWARERIFVDRMIGQQIVLLLEINSEKGNSSEEEKGKDSSEYEKGNSSEEEEGKEPSEGLVEDEDDGTAK